MFQTHLQLLQTPACPTPLSPLGEATLIQQDTTASCTTGVSCLAQETLSSLYNFDINLKILQIIGTSVLCAGLLSPVGPTVVHADTVILRVNITPTAKFTKSYLRGLTWYHNGVEIIPGSYHYDNYYRTISLSSNNTTLTITNAQQSDARVYHVQFAGLRIYPYNKLCEEKTLALLKHYQLLSPVVFSVYTGGE